MSFHLTSERLNKQIPLILPFSKWFKAVLMFYIKLSETLDDNLVEVVAAPNEDMLFHGYNVVVLVKSVTPGVYEAVAKAEEEVSKQYDWQLSISSYVTDDAQATMRFLAQMLAPEKAAVGWSKMLTDFQRKLLELLDDNLVEVIAAPNEDMLFHGYNVVVLVKSVTPGVYEAVAKAEEEVSKQYDWQLSISSYVTRNRFLTNFLKGQLKWRSMKS